LAWTALLRKWLKLRPNQKHLLLAVVAAASK
jgi:hypothetical protein